MLGRRTLGTGALALGATLAAPRGPQAQGRRSSLIMDWALQGVTAPWTMAEDRGWFRAAGADIAVSRGFGSGDTVIKVATGAFDMGYADVYTLMRFMGENPDRKFVAFFMVHDKSALSVAVMADSPIRRPADFAGKTLAAPTGDASRTLFPVFAAKAGFDPNSINWLNVSADLREAMLLRRQADGISGHVTTVAMNVVGANVPLESVRFFPFSDFGLPLYGHVLFCTEAFAQANPAVLTACVRGSVRGLRAMVADPAAAAAASRQREALLDPVIEERRIKLAMDVIFVTPRVQAEGWGIVDMQRLDDTMRDVAGAFALPRQVRAADLYTDRFLPPRGELAFAGS
jgi:NitT/TauT family transport system substrate-binding protein